MYLHIYIILLKSNLTFKPASKPTNQNHGKNKQPLNKRLTF